MSAETVPMGIPDIGGLLPGILGKEPSYLVEGLDAANAALTLANSADNFVVGLAVGLGVMLYRNRKVAPPK